MSPSGSCSRPSSRLADTLVDDYDVVDLLQVLVDTCRDLLDTTAAGILLADARGELELVVSTSEASRLVEMMQLSAEAGPCIESFRSGKRVSVPDIADTGDEWRQFRGAALAQGFRSMDALPLRLRDATIGTLNLLRAAAGRRAGGRHRGRSGVRRRRHDRHPPRAVDPRELGAESSSCRPR